MSPQRRMPQIIPVLDIRRGRVVHAIGGRREDYRPIDSRLTRSTDPGTVAECLLAACNGSELYAADLDAIEGDGSASLPIRELIQACRTPVWLDSGPRRFQQIQDLCASAHVRPVLASETGSIGLVRETLAAVGPGRTAVSIDLRHGQLIVAGHGWELTDKCGASELAGQVARHGIRTVIVLDLARVGTGAGAGTERMLRDFRTALPDVRLIAGGGVRSWADVDALGAAGADAILVASALHDGTLTIPRPVA